MEITSYMKHVPTCVPFGTTYPFGDAAGLDVAFGVEGYSRLEDILASLWHLA